jgi:integrase
VSITVRERKSGTKVRWQADIHAVPRGEAVQDRFRILAPASVTSRSGAQRWAEEQRRRIENQGRPPVTKKGKVEHHEKIAAEEAARPKTMPTLVEFAEQWIAHCEGERQSPATIYSKRDVLKNHLIPVLGNRPLNVLHLEVELQRLKTSMKAYKASTLNLCLTYVQAILRVAQRLGVLDYKASVSKVRVKQEDDAIVFYEPAQYERLLAGAKAKSPDSYACLLLAGEAGLRRGEILALRWSDLVFERDAIEVKTSVWNGRRGPPKGGKSRRVPMTPRVKDALAALPRARESVLVRENGEPATKALVMHLLNAAQRRAKLPITYGPHVLRHTYCTGLSWPVSICAPSRSWPVTQIWRPLPSTSTSSRTRSGSAWSDSPHTAPGPALAPIWHRPRPRSAGFLRLARKAPDLGSLQPRHFAPKSCVQ